MISNIVPFPLKSDADDPLTDRDVMNKLFMARSVVRARIQRDFDVTPCVAVMHGDEAIMLSIDVVVAGAAIDHTSVREYNYFFTDDTLLAIIVARIHRSLIDETLNAIVRTGAAAALIDGEDLTLRFPERVTLPPQS